MFGSDGLTRVSTEDLTRLLRAVHRGELSCPITRTGLATVGLLRVADDLEVLRGLDAASVRVVLVSVISERRRHARIA